MKHQTSHLYFILMFIYIFLKSLTSSAVCLHFPFFLLQILDIPKKTFPKLYELHTIDFSYNNITEIDRSVFVNLLGLRHLNFTHNHLEQIESSTFGKIPTLLNIDLSYNFLKKVQRGAFGGKFILYFVCNMYVPIY